jgi:PAS domain S-box-containing protein
MRKPGTEPGAGSDPSLAGLDESILRIFISSVRDYAILMLDPTGRIISWNPGAEAIKGYTAQEIIGSHFSRFYPPEALQRGLPQHELTVAASVGRFEDEGWRVRKDGTLFWANVIITALRDSTGKLIGYAKLTRDLSERRLHEEAVRQSEERFRSLIEGVKDYAIFMLDTRGFVTTWNAGAQQIKGYLAQEIIGSHFSRFYMQDSIRVGLPDHELRVATMDGRFGDEGWRLRKDGSRFWASVVITAIRDASGALSGFAKITRDLSERREYEQELRASEERFRLLVDGVTEYAIFVLDRNGAVSSWNAGAERIKGYKASEILGKHCSYFFTAEDIAANRPWQHLALARESGRYKEEGWRVRKDGTLFWAGIVVTALHDSEGGLYGYANVTQDLTQRRHTENLADTAQRMHEFIAMLSHELRNPLAPIRNAVALMGRKGLSDPTLEAMRQTIDRQSVHLTRLLDELLDVNRIARGRFTVEREPLDLADVLARAIETSRPMIDARRHRLNIDLPSEPMPLLGDAVRLTQAFVNLLNNAAKYTPDGGEIHLHAAVRDSEIEIRIRDNGKGIEPDKLERVFDLFMQVEPNADTALGGLGVGLALVRRVIELHAGHVQARSEGLGRGTELVTRLPRPSEHLRVVGETCTAPPPASRRLRVLVADDNHDAADSLQLLIQSLDHDAHAAYDGPSALALARSLRPDVVLLDIGMPQMSGYEVARELQLFEEKPVIIAVTGWGQTADRQRSRDAGLSHHFVKPVSEETLRSVLAEIAEQAGPAGDAP